MMTLGPAGNEPPGPIAAARVMHMYSSRFWFLVCGTLLFLVFLFTWGVPLDEQRSAVKPEELARQQATLAAQLVRALGVYVAFVAVLIGHGVFSRRGSSEEVYPDG